MTTPTEFGSSSHKLLGYLRLCDSTLHEKRTHALGQSG